MDPFSGGMCSMDNTVSLETKRDQWIWNILAKGINKADEQSRIFYMQRYLNDHQDLGMAQFHLSFRRISLIAIGNLSIVLI